MIQATQTPQTLQNAQRGLIQAGIPIPPRRTTPYGAERPVLDELQPGESLFFPGKTHRHTGSQIATSKKRHPGRVFTTRFRVEACIDGVWNEHPSDGVPGIRVWRIK